MGFYCVIIHSNFEFDTSVKLFQKEEDAQRYLFRMWKLYMNEEINENNYGHIDKSITYCDMDYGVIAWEDGCRIEFIESFAEFNLEF